MGLYLKISRRTKLDQTPGHGVQPRGCYLVGMQSTEQAPRRRLSFLAGATIVIAAIILGGCGWGQTVPEVGDRSITVSSISSSGFTVTWSAATNDPLFSNFLYEVYVADVPLESLGDVSGLAPDASGTERDFGDSTLSHVVTGLTGGTSYYVTVVASHDGASTAVLYDGLIATTSGSLPASASVAGTTYEALDIGGNGLATTYELTIDAGSTASELFLVFSNPTTSPSGTPPLVGAAPAEVGQVLARSLDQSGPSPDRTAARSARRAPDPPLVREARSLMPTDGTSRAARSLAPNPAINDIEDSTQVTFLDFDFENNPIQIPATAREVRTDPNSGTTLSIFVEDASWIDGGTTDRRVTPEMVTALADAFLLDGAFNDIYDDIRTIFGDEWGPFPDGTGIDYSSLIENEDHITILLYDIEGDQSVDGGVLGYFFAKDNFNRDPDDPVLSRSNERVMFYLDSVLFATKDGLTWDTSDAWPNEIISTLAHEFQHMINFYQRNVLRNVDTAVWLNELLSLVAEDLVANKISVIGPRGVDPPRLDSAGTTSNTRGGDAGRFYDYNFYPFGSLTEWGGGPDILVSYGLSYSFGAFLTRSYGGAALARELVQNTYSTTDPLLGSAIEKATGGPAVDLGTLLRRWGVAVLLSSTTGAPAEATINSGTKFESSVPDDAGEPRTFQLGSINAFNYKAGLPSAPLGPQIFTEDSSEIPTLPPAGALFFRLGGSITGSFTTTVSVPSGVDVTVVRR